MTDKKNTLRFYWIGRFRYKFSHHLINFYERNVPKSQMTALSKKANDKYNEIKVDWNMRYSFGLDEYFALALCITLGLRGLYALTDRSYWHDTKKQMYFGSFFGVYNAHPFHIETLCLVWALNCLNVQLFSLFCRLKHFKWLNIIMMLDEQIPLKNMGLKSKELKEIKFKASLMSYFIRNTIIWLSTICYLILTYKFFNAYSLIDFLIFGIPWSIFYAITTALITSSIYYTNFYVFLISDIMRVKFIRFEKMIDLLSDFSKNDLLLRNPKFLKVMLDRKMYQSYHYLNGLMVEYDIYNNTWKWLATFALLWRFIIINFVSFLAIFYDMPPTFQLMYRSIFMSENFAFLLFLLKVVLIHINMIDSSKRLRQFLYQMKSNPLTLSMQMKTLEYITFLQEPRQFGQTIVSGHLIQLKHVFLIIKEFSSYFLLLASISFRLIK